MSQDSDWNASNQSQSQGNWNTPASDAREAASRLGDEAGRQGAAALDTLKESARSLGDEAKDRASRYVEDGKETVTSSLDTFAQAIRRASDELSEGDQTMAAQLVRQAAGGLESLSRSIGGASVGDMVDSVRSFGRSNPVAFVGVAVLAGLALGRFARASAHRSGRDWGHDRDRGDWERSDWERREWNGDDRRGDSWDESSRVGFDGGLRPYSGPSYPPGERAAFAPATHGGADTPSRAQGYAGGGMDPGPSSETDESMTSSSFSGGSAQPGSISTGGSS